MTYFTDNPLERMMQQRPQGGSDAPRPRPLPKDHRCFGCSRYGTDCLGACHRDLVIQKKEGMNKNETNHR